MAGRKLREAAVGMHEVMISMPRKKFGTVGGIICAAGLGLLIPWAFHIGGRPTALYWSGTGMLLTNTGRYPL